MPSFGIKVSKEGYDARESLGQDLVAFSSYNSPKVVLEGSGTNNWTGTSFVAYTIPHNLGYIPAYDLFVNPVSSGQWYPYAAGHEVSLGVNVTWYTEVDTENIYLYARVEGGGTHRLQFYYLIWTDPGTF